VVLKHEPSLEVSWFLISFSFAQYTLEFVTIAISDAAPSVGSYKMCSETTSALQPVRPSIPAYLFIALED